MPISTNLRSKKRSLLPDDDKWINRAVNLKNDGDFTAKQMWGNLSKIISFSSKNMLKRFHVLGVATDEISLFCHLFSSLNDLRDEFMHYLPNTFTYNDVPGNAVDDDAQDKDENEDS
eukprot:6496584-Ditylum_brightwellii.AAC.1